VKKNLLNFLGIAVLAAVIGFGFAGCKNGTTSGGGGGSGEIVTGGGGSPVFQLAGQFTKSGELGGEVVKFKIADANNYARSARAAGQELAVKGELMDGDITFKLSGTYDPDAKKYSVSSSSSMIRYSITGGYDDNGNSTGSTANLLVKQGEDWKPFTFEVEGKAPSAVTITGEAKESEAGGVPAFAQGYWYFSERDEKADIKMTLLVSQWSADWDEVVIYREDGYKDVVSYKYSIVDVKTLGANKYDVIYAYNDLEMGSSFEQRKAGIAEYLKSKGYGKAVAYTYAELEAMNYVTPSGPGYIFDEWGLSGWFNMPYDIFDDFYNTDYLKKYLVKIGVTPVAMYTKNLFELKNNNTVLEIGYYGDQSSGMPYVTSLAALDGLVLMGENGTMTLKR